MSEINEGQAFQNASDIDYNSSEIDVYAGWDDESTETVVPDTTTAQEETVEETVAENEETVEEVVEDTPTETNPLTFTARIDHRDTEVTLNPDELPTLYQKAQNMDRAVSRADAVQKELDAYKTTSAQIAALARQMGFEGATDAEVTAAMINGVTESARTTQIDDMVRNGTAREVAEYIVDQKMKDAAEHSEVKAEVEEVAEENSDNGPPSKEQFMQDLDKLFAKRENLRNGTDTIPDEVFQAYIAGEDLTVAYLDYESKKNAAEAKKSAKTNKVLKQNEASAKKAIVRGVSGNGKTVQQDDPMLAGWDDAYW